jgi:hypothetical protein
MRDKAAGVLRDGKAAFPDTDSGGFIAHDPRADDGVEVIELWRWISA